MVTWTKDPDSWPPVEDRQRQHWMVERRLREELLASAPAEGERITGEVYDRLFDEVPWHDANVADAAATEAYEEH